MKKIIVSIILMTCASISVCAADKISKENQTILENQNKTYGPKSHWVPSKAQTSMALEAIYKFLNKKMTPDWRNRQRKIIQDQLSSYHVQFVGIIIDGRKSIHCNFFPDEDSFKHDKDSYVYVLDGGASYWRINYDIEKNICFDFEVNGEA